MVFFFVLFLLKTSAAVDAQESRPARREVLASFLAAGAALNFNGQAFAANPIETAKSKAGQAVQGAKGIAGSNPLDNISNPLDNVGNPLGEAQKVAEDIGYELKGQIDGIFKKAVRNLYLADVPLISYHHHCKHVCYMKKPLE